MSYKIGQAVLIEITDEDNTLCPVTTCKGIVIRNIGKTTARISEPHPIWHGAEIAAGRGIRFKRDWDSVPGVPEAEQAMFKRWGVKRHRRPVRCGLCRTKNALATPAPFVCLGCKMQREAA